MGSYTFEGGKTLHLTVGIGSGAFRHPNDPPNVLWTVGDHNPNIACDEMKHIAGVEPGACGEVRNGRVYPTPAYAPSIYRVLLLEDGTFRVTDVLTLKDRDGYPLAACSTLCRRRRPKRCSTVAAGVAPIRKSMVSTPRASSPLGWVVLDRR